MQEEDAELQSSLGKAKTHAGPGNVQVTVEVTNAGSRFKRRILEAKD